MTPTATPKAGSTSERIVLARTMDPNATQAQIARRTGYNKEWVRQVLKKFGLPTPKRPRVYTRCRECGKDTGSPVNRFCNRECFDRNHWTSVPCAQCQGEVRTKKGSVKAAQVRGYRNTFCNRACLGAYLYRRPRNTLSEMKPEDRPVRGYPMSIAGDAMAQVQRAQRTSRSCRKGSHARSGCKPGDHCCSVENEVISQAVKKTTCNWKDIPRVRICQYADGSIAAIRCGATGGKELARTIRYPRDRVEALRILGRGKQGPNVPSPTAGQPAA